MLRFQLCWFDVREEVSCIVFGFGPKAHHVFFVAALSLFLLHQMIAATAVCGMVYAAFAGQPLTIIGSTGPVLAFIAVLYKTSIRMVRRGRGIEKADGYARAPTRVHV